MMGLFFTYFSTLYPKHTTTHTFFLLEYTHNAKRLIKSLASIENKGILSKGDQIKNGKSLFVIARFYLNILRHVMINMVSPKLCIQYQYSCCARWYRIKSTTVVQILYDPNNRNTFCIRPISWHTGCSRGKSSYGHNQLIFLDPARTLPRMKVLGPRRQVSSFLSLWGSV